MSFDIDIQRIRRENNPRGRVWGWGNRVLASALALDQNPEEFKTQSEITVEMESEKRSFSMLTVDPGSPRRYRHPLANRRNKYVNTKSGKLI